MTSKNFKQDLFYHFARIGKAVSNPNRLELLEILAQGERCVEDMVRQTGLSTANVSQHLQHLRRAGLVLSRKQGLQVFYRLSGDDVVTLIHSMRLVAERHLADVDQLLRDVLDVKDNLEPVARLDLLQRVKTGRVTVVDVRPEQEYNNGHVAGALNIPLDQLEAQLNQLPKEHEVVAYCRGPHCVLAFEAVQRLRQLGFNARRLQDGFPEWKTAGLPVE